LSSSYNCDISNTTYNCSNNVDGIYLIMD